MPKDWLVTLETCLCGPRFGCIIVLVVFWSCFRGLACEWIVCPDTPRADVGILGRWRVPWCAGHQSLASSIAKYRVRRDSTLHGWHLKPFAYLRVIQRKWNMWGVSSCWCLCDQGEPLGKICWMGLPDFHMFGFASMWFSMLVDRTWWTHWLPYILTAYGQILHHLIL